jgi:pimeloyl-ACP methyl ester carboxylesterase
VVWQIRRAAPEYVAADLIGYADFDRRADMGSITSPVLLLRGSADWLVNQEMVEATASRVPNARVKVLEGTGHYPMIENPAEFNDAIRGFLHEAL